MLAQKMCRFRSHSVLSMIEYNSSCYNASAYLLEDDNVGTQLETYRPRFIPFLSFLSCCSIERNTYICYYSCVRGLNDVVYDPS